MSKGTALSLIGLANQLVSDPYSNKKFIFEDWEYDSPAIAVPVMSMPPEVAIDIPDYVTINIPQPEGLHADPIPAAYTAVESILELGDVPLPTAPTYMTPYTLGPVTYGNFEQPPINYPNEAPIDLPPGAGLSELTFYMPPFEEQPEFDEIIVEPYMFTPLELFAEPIPEYDEFEEPRLIQLDAYEVFEEDAELLEAMGLAAVEGGKFLDGVMQETMLAFKLTGFDQAEREQEAALFAKVAAAGFSLPNPELIAGMLDLSIKGKAKREEANREVTKEVNERNIETMQAAITGMQMLEKAHVSLYIRYIQRLTKAYKLNVRMATVLYEAIAKSFNTKLSAIEALIADYNAYVRTVRIQASALEDQAAGEDAKARSEQAKLTAFGAQLDTVKAIAKSEQLRVEQTTLPLQEYSSTLRGVLANVDIVKGNIQAYGDAVSAYAKATDAQAGLADAYSAEVEAAVSANAVYESNFKAAEGYAKTELSRAQAYGSGVDNWTGILDALIREYREYGQAQRTYLQTLTSKVAAEIAQNDTYVKGMTTVTNYANAWNRARVELTGVKNAYSIALAESVTRQQALANQAGAANARIEAGFLGAKASAAASQTQAAYGVTSGTMRVSGAVGSQNNTSDRGTTAWNVNGFRGYNMSRQKSIK